MKKSYFQSIQIKEIQKHENVQNRFTRIVTLMIRSMGFLYTSHPPTKGIYRIRSPVDGLEFDLLLFHNIAHAVLAVRPISFLVELLYRAHVENFHA